MTNSWGLLLAEPRAGWMLAVEGDIGPVLGLYLGAAHSPGWPVADRPVWVLLYVD